MSKSAYTQVPVLLPEIREMLATGKNKEKFQSIMDFQAKQLLQ